MKALAIFNSNKKDPCSKLKIKVIECRKFLEFQLKTNKFIIWKLMFTDYSSKAVSYCDENFYKKHQETFYSSDVKIIFYRGKKRFIFKKLRSKRKKTSVLLPLLNNQPNISVIEHKLI